MKALVFGPDGLRFERNHPEPEAAEGEALVRVRLAGICNTDVEIVRGYMGFAGVPGHEFVGEVDGQRVAGEINAACGHCSWCERGLGRHCPNRTVLGILGRDGTFAEYLTLPRENLHPLPDSLDDEVAVFVEPTAAAFEILEQVPLSGEERVALLGDGKLALLIAQVLRRRCRLSVFGKHQEKLRLLRDVDWSVEPPAGQFDVVVEATGSERGFQQALELVRPRGTLVLKSTVAAGAQLNLAPIVINEVTVVGSRCGLFEPAIAALASGEVDPRPLISAVYPLEEGLAAFDRAQQPGVLKVLLKPTPGSPGRGAARR
ncbi:MAG TPA: alcohol dehydrogenase catalytic domain-containing protein [Chloroflexota bacterium]|nr:alcohol dehydrogenase catalytic domain-containing protein [Chloroflexota bacterium]